jgi:hypothetical protein
MSRSRQRAYDIRTGRRRASHDIAVPPPSRASAAAYELLVPRLTRLRAVLAAVDAPAGRSIVDVRHDHADFDDLLADAVRQAFAADVLDAPKPDGISSWVAEGLARSQERELALFAAADAYGAVQAATAPSPRW